MTDFPPLPPGFQPFNLNQRVRSYTRHLPHWRQDGATYFVTFRLADSLPEIKLSELKTLRSHWEHSHPQPHSEKDLEAYAREFRRRCEAWLDEGHGACQLRDPCWANDLLDCLQYFNGTRYQLCCSVVMPNHCHALIRPFNGYQLERLLGGVKGVVARHINSSTGSHGNLWQQECYDRIVRDAQHLHRVIQYIGRNPALMKLPEDQWHRWIDPTWVQAGWGFQ